MIDRSGSVFSCSPQKKEKEEKKEKKEKKKKNLDGI
jgi:hypothetical protein